MKFKILYTCNCIDKWMRDGLLNSIISARRFVSKEDIVVIFHPPLMDLDEIESMFLPYCDLRFIDDILTTPFAIHPSRGKGSERWYGEKLRIKDFEDENMLFLDCDTIVRHHPKKLFEGDFEFGGCAMDLLPQHWQSRTNVRIRTKRIFKIPYELTHCWEGSCLIFKKHTHTKIGNEWLRVLEEDRYLLDLCQSPNRKTYEQSALIPVVARNNLKTKILKMNKEIFFRCSYVDVDSMNGDVIIVHGNDLASKLGIIDEIETLKEELK